MSLRLACATINLNSYFTSFFYAQLAVSAAKKLSRESSRDSDKVPYEASDWGRIFRGNAGDMGNHSELSILPDCQKIY